MDVRGKSVLLSVLSGLFINAAQAGQYWLSSDGVPVRDSAGSCVAQGVESTQLQPGCDPMNRVILLPDSEGHVGAVVVVTEGSSKTLTTAYGAAYVGTQGQLEDSAASESEVSSRFGPLLQQQPTPPATFTLRFQSGSATELTPDSEAVIQQLSANLEDREAPEIRIVGHTDRVGSLLANDRLSKGRAQTVAEILAAKGIPKNMMEITGRGEREPEIATDDGVDEPRNRRVEISIR